VSIFCCFGCTASLLASQAHVLDIQEQEVNVSIFIQWLISRQQHRRHSRRLALAVSLTLLKQQSQQTCTVSCHMLARLHIKPVTGASADSMHPAVLSATLHQTCHLPFMPNAPSPMQAGPHLTPAGCQSERLAADWPSVAGCRLRAAAPAATEGKQHTPDLATD
jgi:hypothetical protein